MNLRPKVPYEGGKTRSRSHVHEPLKVRVDPVKKQEALRDYRRAVLQGSPDVGAFEILACAAGATKDEILIARRASGDGNLLDRLRQPVAASPY